MSLRANLFQVVAFAADPLHGNSAFALTGVGEATDDPALKGEGKGQEAKGDLQKAVGNAKSAIKKAADL